MTDSLNELAAAYEEFVDARDWDRFHTPQNLAMAISTEANELLEALLWFNNPSADAVQADEEVMAAVREELADVVIYTLGMANQLDIDLAAAVEAKLEANRERFDEPTAAEISERLEEWQ